MPQDTFPFARRTSWVLTTNHIAGRLSALRKAGTAVLDLTESNPTRCGLNYPVEEILRGLGRPENLHYHPHEQGHPAAREAVSGYYKKRGLDVPPERIFLTSSTSEAYSYLFRLLADSGQEILFPQPSYPLFQFLTDLNDLHMETYPLVYDGRWGMDLERLEQNVRASTRAVVLVNPNNPTGSYIRADELEQLNHLCAARRLAIICDEVFWDFAFEDGQRVSLAVNEEALTFTLGGLSKSLGLPQMKLSWIVLSGPAELCAAAAQRLTVICDTYLSVNTPVENALSYWMDREGDIQGQIRGRVICNRRRAMDLVRAYPMCEILSAEGGWYLILKVPAVEKEEQWVLGLLGEKKVFVHPGYFFDLTEGAHLVVSLLPAPEVFERGIRAVLEYIDARVS